MVEDTRNLELSVSTYADWFDGTSTSVNFIHDQDYYTYSRTIYTILDYLRDIGGLLSSFTGIFAGIIFIVNYNGIYHWLAAILYRVQSLSDYSS